MTISTPVPTSKCGARNKATCRYHGAFVALEAAMASGDFNKIQAARELIAENERNGIVEEKQPEITLNKADASTVQWMVAVKTQRDDVKERQLREALAQRRGFSKEDARIVEQGLKYVDELRAQRPSNPVEQAKQSMSLHRAISHLDSSVRHEGKHPVVNRDGVLHLMANSKRSAENLIVSVQKRAAMGIQPSMGAGEDVFNEINARAELDVNRRLTRIFNSK